MRKNMLWLLAMMLALACAGCSPFVPAQVLLQTPQVEAPITVQAGLPLVQVTINGLGPYTFLLDTGSVAVILSEPLAEQLSLPSMNLHVKKVAPDGQRVPAVKVVRVAEMRCGDIAFRDFGAAVLDTSGFDRRGLVFDGILGLAPFRSCLLTLDMQAKRLIVEQGLLDPRDPMTFAWDEDAQTPTVPVLIEVTGAEPRLAHLVVDSGSNGGLALPRKAREWALSQEPHGSVSSMSIAGESSSPVYELNATVSVGPRQYSRLLVQYENGPGRVGMWMLSRMKITIDSQRRLVRMR